MSLPQALAVSPVIAIVRHQAEADLVATCNALYAGGIRAVEITLPTPGSLAAIEQARDQVGSDHWIGAGTVLDVQDARRAIDAGAQFLVTPTLDLPTISLAVEKEVPIFPGVFTPTEALAAWRAGATAVKLFPAGQLGPAFLKNLLAPLPQIRVAPTGGITLDNAASWLTAGASALGVGSSLVQPSLLESGDWKSLTGVAAQWVAACDMAKPIG